MKSASKDYHDYVFRDGKLVGEFEDMYRNSATVPWHQDDQAQWMDIRLTWTMLGDIGRFDEVHDLGCGTGHFLDLLCRHLGVPNCRGFGYDVSPTACEIAQRNFPGSSFQVLDLTAGTAGSSETAQHAVRRLFSIRGTLWYVFPQLPTVIAAIRRLMSNGDQLLVVQNFPPLDRPFIGKEVIPDQLALIRHFTSHFLVSRHLWYEDRSKTANDNWFIGLFSTKGE